MDRSSIKENSTILFFLDVVSFQCFRVCIEIFHSRISFIFIEEYLIVKNPNSEIKIKAIKFELLRHSNIASNQHLKSQ